MLGGDELALARTSRVVPSDPDARIQLSRPSASKTSPLGISVKSFPEVGLGMFSSCQRRYPHRDLRQGLGRAVLLFLDPNVRKT